MEFCIKTLGHWITGSILWLGNIYLWLLEVPAIRFLDSSMKYITFGAAIASTVIYGTLIVLKKKKERKQIELTDLEIEASRLDNKIKTQQLIEMQNKNRNEKL